MENTHSCIPVEYLKIIEEQREKTERTREMILRYERRRIINEYFTESESDDSDNDRARSRRNSWGSKENGRKEVESSNEEEESRQEFESRKEEEEEAEEAEEAEEEEAEEAEEEEEEAEGAEEEEEKTPGLDDLQAHRCLQKYLKKLQAAQATREWVIKSDL